MNEEELQAQPVEQSKQSLILAVVISIFVGLVLGAAVTYLLTRNTEPTIPPAPVEPTTTSEQDEVTIKQDIEVISPQADQGEKTSFENTKYNYSILYSPEFTDVVSNEYGGTEASESGRIVLFDSRPYLTPSFSGLNVWVDDPSNSGGSGLSLKDYAESEWNTEKSTAAASSYHWDVSNFEKVDFLGLVAYQYTSDRTYPISYDSSKGVQKQASNEFLYLYFTFNDLHYKISFPRSEYVYLEMFESFNLL